MTVGHGGEPPVLELVDVRHSFGGNHVLKGVSLSVASGSVTSLIGPNGSGKTTLFNVISGFLRPDAGRVVFLGRDITRLAVAQRSRLGLVRTFQAPQLFADMSVVDNVLMGRYKAMASGFTENLLWPRRGRRELGEARERARSLLERHGLAELADVEAGGLPAGLQRLVELIRAAVSEPRLLLLDEPSSGLNAEEIASFAEVVRTLQGEGTSIFLVSHDMSLVATLATTVHVLNFGELIAAGTPAELQADERVREVYLGHGARRDLP